MTNQELRDRETLMRADAVITSVSRLFHYDSNREVVKAVFERYDPRGLSQADDFNPNELSERFEYLASLARSVGR